MIEIQHFGNFKKTEKFLKEIEKDRIFKQLRPLAEEGVRALSSATPSLTGVTANSWGYDIVIDRGGATIFWTNFNIINGFSVAIGLQYGHATGTGGWVSGQDYINPAIQPIFDKISREVWKVVTNA